MDFLYCVCIFSGCHPFFLLLTLSFSITALSLWSWCSILGGFLALPNQKALLCCGFGFYFLSTFLSFKNLFFQDNESAPLPYFFNPMCEPFLKLEHSECFFSSV